MQEIPDDLEAAIKGLNPEEAKRAADMLDEMGDAFHARGPLYGAQAGVSPLAIGSIITIIQKYGPLGVDIVRMVIERIKQGP